MGVSVEPRGHEVQAASSLSSIQGWLESGTSRPMAGARTLPGDPGDQIVLVELRPAKTLQPP